AGLVLTRRGSVLELDLSGSDLKQHHLSATRHVERRQLLESENLAVEARHLRRLDGKAPEHIHRRLRRERCERHRTAGLGGNRDRGREKDAGSQKEFHGRNGRRSRPMSTSRSGLVSWSAGGSSCYTRRTC